MNDLLPVAIAILIVLLGICFIGWMAMWADRDEYKRRLDVAYDNANSDHVKHRAEVAALKSSRDLLAYRIQEELRRPQGA